MSSNTEKQKENIPQEEKQDEVKNSSPPKGSNVKSLTSIELKRYIKKVMQEMKIIPDDLKSQKESKKSKDFNKNLKVVDGFSSIFAGSLNKISDHAGDNVVIAGGTENEMYGLENSGIYSSVKSLIDVRSHGIIIGGTQNVITSSVSSSIISGNRNVCENVDNGNISYSDKCRIDGLQGSSIQYSKDSEILRSENSHVLFCSNGKIKSANNSIMMSSEDSKIKEDKNNVFILHGKGIVASSGLVTGKYNKISEEKEDEAIFEIGNGKDEDHRNTALKVTENGTFIDRLHVKSTGFGEYFEIADADIRSGTVVELTMNGKIKVSESLHKSIGIVADSCSVIGGEATKTSKIVCLKGTTLVRKEYLELIPNSWFIITEDEEDDTSEFVKVVII